MKNLFIMLLILASTTISAQQIITNIVTLKDDIEAYSIQPDTFYFSKEKVIWYPANKERCYFKVLSCTKINEYTYKLKCKGNKNISMITVDFKEEVIELYELIFMNLKVKNGEIY
jgi:hypothetical protein